MKSTSINLSQKDPLPSFENHHSLLIQLFCGEMEKFEEYTKLLHSKYPFATIIGSTTDGEIYKRQITTHQAIVSFTLLERTRIEGIHHYDPDSYKCGLYIAKQLQDAKAIIAFAEAFSLDHQKFLDALDRYPFIVAGGLAGANGEFDQTYVCLNGEIYDKGVVCAGLFNENLLIERFYHFGWQKIGVPHTITKSRGNRLYTIENSSAKAFYAKYLGQEIAQELPKVGVEFPLLLEQDGIKKAYAPLKVFEDESFQLPGDIEEGEKVYLSIGNPHALAQQKSSLSFEPEALFLYSCMARRRFLELFARNDLAIFPPQVEVSGFFTYGEFFTGEKKEMFNETATFLAMSEHPSSSFPLNSLPKNRTIPKEYSALFHAIDAISKDYIDLTKKLEKELRFSSKLLQEKNLHFETLFTNMHEGMVIFDDNGKILLCNDSFAKLFDTTTAQIQNQNIQALFPEPLSFPQKIKQRNLQYRDKELLYNLVPFDKKLHLLTIIDITEYKKREQLLIQQSKLAQMGEMVNMIAHQWRQPLNLISTLMIQMEIQNEMDNLSKKEIARMTQQVQKTIQSMSKTIDLFLNFSKNSKKAQTFSLTELVEDIFTMFAPQLSAHGIFYSLERQEDIVVTTFKNELMQVLINIISNAKDALLQTDQEKRCIRLRISEKEDMVRIDIEDNAGGIPPQYLDRIFEPYFTTKLETKGTGLGLYMSKLIVEESLKGEIMVKNTQEGACFTIELPIGGGEIDE